ncbi:MAG: VPLPA-CTERM sorting domain-containing protein [Deltaproteobacteria bacterium]|jgi:hypothetical protein|nr:VPLPA-CTERM sorting domain-containing protein [Deltaproteobacteria bacterium]
MFNAVILIIVIFVSTPTSFAAIWNMNADALTSSMSAFTVQFKDVDNNNTVSYLDVVWFSGVTWHSSSGDVFFNQIIFCPDRTIDVGLTLTNSSSGVQLYWGFSGSYPIYPGDTDVWAYDATPQVPIPAAVWLLGSGLIGIVGVRRKFRK